MIRLLAVVALFSLLAGCGSANNFNLACGNSSDCTSGQVCPAVGPMQGRCTKACTKDEECTALSSQHVVCTSDVCVPSP